MGWVRTATLFVFAVSNLHRLKHSYAAFIIFLFLALVAFLPLRRRSIIVFTNSACGEVDLAQFTA